MGKVAWCVLATCVLLGCVGRSEALDESGALPRPRIGTYFDLRSNKPEKSNRQFLAVLTPGSSSRRPVDPETGFAPSESSGLTIYMRKHRRDLFRRTRTPFKLRVVRPDPAGVLDTAVEEGRVSVYEGGGSSGKSYRIVPRKSTPWWKRLL